MSFYRIDKQQTITQVSTTDEGYLQVLAPIARSGVYNYLLPNGTIQREYIPPETLSNTDSINSLKMKPVTNNHPEDFVNSDSFQNVAVGSVGENVYYEDGNLFSKFTVTVQDAIDTINDGKNQLSPAYECELDMVKGVTPNGEHYDAIQINRKYNHLAIVDKARGGDSLNFKMDSNTEISIEINEHTNLIKGDAMPSIRIDGIDHTVDSEVVAKHISTLINKVDAVGDELKSEKAEVVKLQAKVDSKEAEVVKLQAKVDSAPNVAELVSAKLKLVDSAEKVLGKDGVKVTDSDEAIMKAVVLKSTPEAKAKIDSYEGDAKNIYLKARFDSAIELVDDNEDDVAKNRKDGASGDGDKKMDSRQKHIEATQNKWKAGK